MDDLAEWFTNPEHAHIVGIDLQLTRALRLQFGILEIEVDCGVEGEKSFTYHFRISNVAADMRGRVCSRATDLLSCWTPYRFEIRCI